MKACILCIIIMFAYFTAFSQGSNSAQFGVMYPCFKKNSPYVRNFWPGFSINAFGFSVSYFAGRNYPIVRDPQSLYDDNSVGGSFFDIGYKYEFQKLSPFKRKIKRPFLFPTLGAGLGGYSLNDRTGFQFNLRPGIKLAIIPGVYLFAEGYSGFNALNDDLETEKEKSIKGWFFAPTFGIEFKTNLQNILDEVWGPKVELAEGWVDVEYKDRNGVTIMTDKYYREKGTYVQSYFMNSRNVVNLYGTGLLGTGQTNKGRTLAGGAGLAIRTGMFAFDFEYTLGKIGYMYEDEDARMQNSWNMKRFAFMAGIDIFRLHKPFSPPGFVRVIIGAKLGVQTLVSNLNNYSKLAVTISTFEAQNLRNKFYCVGYVGVEYGTLGFSVEAFRCRDAADKSYKAGMVIGARYMIPLVMTDAQR